MAQHLAADHITVQQTVLNPLNPTKLMLELFNNICLLTDSYKFSHYRQYPSKTHTVYSYLESRGGKFDLLVFYGAQYIIMKHLCGVVVTQAKINEAERFCNKHMGPGHFNRAGWEHILNVHGGRLPIRIKAVPEGTLISPHNVMMTVENTDPDCFWLTNYLETLLVQIWYPITVASQSRSMGETLHAALLKSGDPSLLPFKLHDFGFRGVTCVEQAGIGCSAHLISFQGTDTPPGIELIEAVYTADESMADDFDPYYDKNGDRRRPRPEFDRFGDDFNMPGFSIPASEHSTITSWGREHEVDAMRNMLTAYPSGLVACVSDSFDIYKACEQLWGTELREQILSRDGVLVIRPDSGDAHVVLPRILEILGDKFGFVTNDKGFKVLNPKVRIIQGDGINAESLKTLLETVMSAGWSADNIAFGSGGGLLQMVNRDTSKYAFKCSAIDIDGEWHDVYKDPVTDPGKTSKRGRLKLVESRIVLETCPPQDGGAVFHTLTEHDGGYEGATDTMCTIFENGELIVHDEFSAIRARAAIA